MAKQNEELTREQKAQGCAYEKMKAEYEKLKAEQEQWIKAAKEAANGGTGLIVKVMVCKTCEDWNAAKQSRS
jgi:hypothetical protein